MSAEDFDIEETTTQKALRRLKSDPLVAVGIGGFLTSLAVGAYKFKNRPAHMNIPFFLVRLRVVAQSAVIGGVSLSMMYGMFNQYILKKPAAK